ncbi:MULTISPECIES: type VI secretion system protein TssA [unclassified Uliginosibacterium]|uniref:type VI secretion system protein TssA n=1 Tax=unclassified Uliginosibacterium TaxID=2621521 RepID=UPI000C7BD3A8|nr:MULTISPECIES: type VI secretion system protein TssA [unclassified Uliginosibacterium]MDO6384667.1 type VI secretion system protein TssA [Uliginosibacterium sp. 31-12]PLK48386.1 type VI secretion system protein TssA [Uliginosibacterium sp. TH139]
MNASSLPELDALGAALSDTNPCGEDMSFSSEFDEIQEARREDDPSIDQGEWVTSIKEADWKRAASVCQQLLTERTKDLRLASWLTEALAKTHGISGMNHGLRAIDELVCRFWSDLHPQAEDGDQEQRIGNIGWLITRGVQLVRGFPVVQGKAARYTLGDLNAARALQSLLDRNQAPEDDGSAQRITLQQVRDAQRSSPRAFYEQTLAACTTCLNTLEQLGRNIDAHLGMDGPSFTPLRSAIEAYAAEIERMARENGISAEASRQPLEASGGESLANETPSATQTSQSGGPLRSREQALKQLREVADFFRRTEPHSPVAYLADKAANWGEMPLHVWLKTVLKEEGALSRFEDLLGFDAGEEH